MCVYIYVYINNFAYTDFIEIIPSATLPNIYCSFFSAAFVVSAVVELNNFSIFCPVIYPDTNLIVAYFKLNSIIFKIFPCNISLLRLQIPK